MMTSAQAGPENALEGILIQTIQEKLSRNASDNVAFMDAILPVFCELLEFSEQIVQDLEASGQSPKIACKSGCSYCCHSQVSIIPIEALLISGFIDTDYTCAQVRALREEISQIRLLTSHKTQEEIYALKGELPCLFLKKGKCSIYKRRPSICRSWNSLDSDACRLAYDSTNFKASVSVSPARNFVFGTTRALFGRLSKALLLQSETLLLHNAVADCLGCADPLDRWARGDNVFGYGEQSRS